MVRITDHHRKLTAGYLFPDIGRRVRAFAAAHPDARLIRLGLGAVPPALPPAGTDAMHRALDEQASPETFKGDGPEQGYPFLREAIAEHDFASGGVRVSPDEVFGSDGSKCDSANIQEIFATDIRLAVSDPVYP